MNSTSTFTIHFPQSLAAPQSGFSSVANRGLWIPSLIFHIASSELLRQLFVRAGRDFDVHKASANLVVVALDPEPIARFLRQLHPPGQVFEIRIPHCAETPGRDFTSTHSGFFDSDHIDAAATAIAAIDTNHKPAGIYVTINPVDPALIARAHNRIKAKAQTSTGDQHVVSRRWLMLDLDPVRPSGISSTKSEADAAVGLARRIRDELRELDWPDPLVCMSGNGAYLLYRVDLPNDEASKALIQGVLKGLAGIYNTAEVQIDQTTFNAARIVKVMGTTARKGDSVADRPHRRAKVLDASDGELGIVPRERLQALVPALEPTEFAANNRPARNGDRFERVDNNVLTVRSYLERHGVQVQSEKSHGAYTQLVLDRCPITGAEGGTSVAVRIGASGISYHNLHARAVGAADNWLALRDHLEPGYREFVESWRRGERQRESVASSTRTSSGESNSVDPAQPDSIPAESGPACKLRSFADDLAEFEAWLPTQHGRPFIGLATGRFSEIDNRLCGLRGLIVMAAMPGVGKTSFGLNLGLAAVANHVGPDAERVAFVFFSFEMARQAMTTRLVSFTSGLQWRRLVLGDSKPTTDSEELHFSDVSAEKYHDGLEQLREFHDRIVIIDRQMIPPFGLSTPGDWIAAHIEQAKLETGASRAFVLIDSLQTIPVVENASRRERLDVERFLMGELRGVSDRYLTDPIFVISEQSKDGFGRSDLGAVLGAGRNVYSADVVMFLTSDPNANDNDDAPLTQEAAVDLDLHISKARDGMIRKPVSMRFYYKLSRFEETPNRALFEKRANSDRRR